MFDYWADELYHHDPTDLLDADMQGFFVRNLGYVEFKPQSEAGTFADSWIRNCNTTRAATDPTTAATPIQPNVCGPR